MMLNLLYGRYGARATSYARRQGPGRCERRRLNRLVRVVRLCVCLLEKQSLHPNRQGQRYSDLDYLRVRET